MEAAHAHIPASAPSSSRRWWALSALVLYVLVIGFDGTILNVALPQLSRQLGADTGQLQWIVAGYLVAFAAVMLPVGLLGDSIGHKKVLLAGITLFGAASLAGALVDSPGALIAARGTCTA
ncbi:MFS transporter [Streptomyces sp. T-3]|nr:MFS transporter [Streptomyces sp. T-3]